MSAPELRPYQRDVIARISAAIVAGHRRICLVSPTGSGKTVIASAMTNDAVARQQKVMFTAHRVELTRQTVPEAL